MRNKGSDLGGHRAQGRRESGVGEGVWLKSYSSQGTRQSVPSMGGSGGSWRGVEEEALVLGLLLHSSISMQWKMSEVDHFTALETRSPRI